MGEMETQAVHELITWNIMEDQVAETLEARKRANQRRNTVQKEKDAGLDQIATIARTLVIPLNCFHTGRHENTGSKAINTRSRDLRWPVTDSSKNSSVRLKADPHRTNLKILQATQPPPRHLAPSPPRTKRLQHRANLRYRTALSRLQPLTLRWPSHA